MSGTVQIEAKDSTTKIEGPVNKTAGGLLTYEVSAPPGVANPASALASYGRAYAPGTPILLSGTAAVTIGGSAVAGDMMLLGIVILSNAAAVTATIAGMADQTGAAQNIVLTGSTTVDTTYLFGPMGLVNAKGALTITPSVTLKVLAIYRAV